MIVDIHINLYNIPPLVVHVGITHTYVCLKGMKQKIIIKKQHANRLDLLMILLHFFHIYFTFIFVHQFFISE